MRTRRLVGLILPLLLLLAANLIPTPASASGTAKKYVCVPCGLPCDTGEYDHPGLCPKCGMPLVDKDSIRVDNTPHTKVAILIFDGVEIIDYTGPYEMFGDAGYDVYTVAATKDPVTTAMGMTVVPKFTFADAPKADVLLVPGGGVKGARSSEPTLQWVRDMSAHSKHTLSVCNGAFILASAGLLDGLTATTTARLIPQLGSGFPKVKVVNDRRFVDNGKIITAAGLSSGIDGALHVISLLDGNGTAQKVALDQEYDWRPESGFARGSFADLQIPQMNLENVGKLKILSTTGGKDRWEVRVSCTPRVNSGQVMSDVCKELETQGKWSVDGTVTAGNQASTTRHWKFTGTDGKAWTGTLTMQPGAGPGPDCTLQLIVSRDGV